MSRSLLARLPLCLAVLWLAQPCTLAAELEYVHLGKVEFIENETVRLGVAPKIGRIVSFQRKEGQEWIVAVDKAAIPSWFWNPWGGDRVWPTAQFLLPQIYGNAGFDPVIDGKPWEIVARSASSMELRSGLSPQLGVRITRKIELQPSAVLHTFEVAKERPAPFPVHIWTVTGIALPDYALLASDPKVPHQERLPFKWWREHAATAPEGKLLEGTRVLKMEPSPKSKVGTYGKWIAAVRGGEAFLQTLPYLPDALYLEASNLQFYADPKEKIYELEALSRTWFLAPGEAKTWEIRWKLVEIPKPAPSEAQVAELLQKEL